MYLGIYAATQRHTVAVRTHILQIDIYIHRHTYTHTPLTFAATTATTLGLKIRTRLTNCPFHASNKHFASKRNE